MAHVARAQGRREGQYLATHQGGLLALSKGLAPAIAVEFARRAIPAELRPTFDETEQFCRAPQADAAGRGGVMSPGRSQPIIVKKQEGRAPRPSRRRLEGGLRRLRDRDDGVLPRDVAGRPEQGGQERPSPATSAIPASSTRRSRTARSPAAISGSIPEAAPPDEAASGDGMAESERAALEETAERIKQRLAELAGPAIAREADRDPGDARRPAHRAARRRVADFFASGSAALAAGTEKVLAADRARARRR